MPLKRGCEAAVTYHRRCQTRREISRPIRRARTQRLCRPRHCRPSPPRQAAVRKSRPEGRHISGVVGIKANRRRAEQHGVAGTYRPHDRIFDRYETEHFFLVRYVMLETAKAVLFRPLDNIIERQTEIARHQPLVFDVDPANAGSGMMQISRTRGGDIVADQAETNCFQGNLRRLRRRDWPAVAGACRPLDGPRANGQAHWPEYRRRNP